MYTPQFVRQFFDNFENLAGRMHSGERFYLRSVADEFAFRAIIEEAKDWLEETKRGSNSDNIEWFYAMVCEDFDFELLFDPQYDGFERDEAWKGRFGLANLAFEDWFKWFANVE